MPVCCRVRHATGFDRLPSPARRSRAGWDSGPRPRPARSHSGRRRARAARARPRQAAPAALQAASCEPARSQAIESQTRTVIAGGARFALFDHVEVVVERRHFVDFRHRHLHLVRERDQMRRGQAAVPVLNLVQMLDQQIAAARRIAEQGQDILARLRIDSPPFRCGAYPAASTALLLFRGLVQAWLR